MKLTQTKLCLLAAIFFVVVDNFAFFQHVLAVFPLSVKNLGFLVSLTIGLTAFITLVLTLVCYRRTIKPVLILLLLVSAAASYFMNNYSVVMDTAMIRNIVETNLHESLDLFNWKLVAYLCFLGGLPAFLVATVEIEPVTWRRSLLTRITTGVTAALVVFAMILSFSKFYTSFFREHKPLRYYTNPTYYIYSVGKYVSEAYSSGKAIAAPLGTDARIVRKGHGRELVVLVVGESARADRFSLNGYRRDTNPLLGKEDVVSFTDMYSCGTSTAYSVPCMFSQFGRDDFTDSKGESNENLLDVLSHAGVHVLWRDNNSDSKGVALRVEYQDYKRSDVNPDCEEGECRDEGMLVGLQEYINAQQKGDILIVLHQMGNHGPAYYKRYPKAFEKYEPVCRTNEFDKCTNEEINNAYDNAILYTDYFLDKVIALLKQNSEHFETAMIYMSDHGESLGEYGIYLHALPYSMAPDQQKHIASVFWFGKGFDVDRAALRAKAGKPYSHDNLFHTVLGMMGVQTSVYDKSLDIVHAGG